MDKILEKFNHEFVLFVIRAHMIDEIREKEMTDKSKFLEFLRMNFQWLTVSTNVATSSTPVH